MRADTWGSHRLGAVNLSLRRPLGVTVWELVHDDSPSFNVLPSPEHLRQLLPPPASQSAAGVHISRLVGDGFDFAELRPFAAGDRLRDINWRASARSDQLQTNRRHPDRSGEVVLLLDTFADGIGTASVTAQAALTRAGPRRLVGRPAAPRRAGSRRAGRTGPGGHPAATAQRRPRPLRPAQHVAVDRRPGGRG